MILVSHHTPFDQLALQFIYYVLRRYSLEVIQKISLSRHFFQDHRHDHHASLFQSLLPICHDVVVEQMYHRWIFQNKS